MKHVIKVELDDDLGLKYTIYDSDTDLVYEADYQKLRGYEKNKELSGLSLPIEDFEHRYIRDNADYEDLVLLQFMYRYNEFVFISEYGTIWVYKNHELVKRNKYTLAYGCYTLEDKDILWFPEGRGDDYISVVSYNTLLNSFRRYHVGVEKVHENREIIYTNAEIDRVIFRAGTDDWRDKSSRKIFNVRNEHDITTLDKALAIYYPKITENIIELYKEISENLISQKENFWLDENIYQSKNSDSRLGLFGGFAIMATYLLNKKLIDRRKKMVNKLGLFNLRYDIDGEYKKQGDLIQVTYQIKLQGTAMLFMSKDVFPTIERGKTLIETRSLDTWEVVE